MSAKVVSEPLASATAVQTIGKRKRSQEPDVKEADGDASDREARMPAFRAFLGDLLEILKSFDENSLILGWALPSPDAQPRASKRAKLSSAEATETIESKILAERYENIEQLEADIKSVVGLVKQDSTEGTSASKEKLATVINAYIDIVQREAAQNPSTILHSDARSSGAAEQEEQDKLPLRPSKPPQNILTLFGGTQYGAKQLFSSLRSNEPDNFLDDENSTATIGEKGAEPALPNGISTTAIIPVHSSTKDARGKVPTLGDLCPTPAHMGRLEPPKPSSLTTSRDQKVRWFKPSEYGSPPRRRRGWDNFPYQTQTVGNWLSYTTPLSPPRSPESKRTQKEASRDGGEQSKEDRGVGTDAIQREEEAYRLAKTSALARSVFSSFAPSFDNTNAVVSQAMKRKVWWHRNGQRRYGFEEDLLGLFNETENDDAPDSKPGQNEEDEFREAVESFEENTKLPKELVLPEDREEKDPADKETDELLAEISELLQILQSYQRNRFLSARPSSRSSQSQGSPGKPSGPSVPTEAESLIYKTLQSQLALIVASLPPYALSKLDGDQLGELMVSKQIQIETPWHNGVIPDEAPKPAPHPTSGTPGSIVRHSSVSMRGGTYQTIPANMQRPGSFTPGRPSSYYANRPPGSTGQPAGNYTTYQQQTPSRPMYGQYGSQTVHSAPSVHYANGTRHYTQGSFSSYNAQTGSPGQVRTPQARPIMQQAQPSRATAFPHNYNSPGFRSISPQNPNAAFAQPQMQQQQQQQQQRVSLSAASPQRPAQLPAQQPVQQQLRPQQQDAQAPSAGGNAGVNGTPAVVAAAATIGQHMQLTPQEQQARLMNRQKMQIQQQQLQQQQQQQQQQQLQQHEQQQHAAGAASPSPSLQKPTATQLGAAAAGGLAAPAPGAQMNGTVGH